MSEVVNFLMYRSLAKIPARSTDEVAIYHDASARNARLNLTSFLNRDVDEFFQYLEGPNQSIDDVMRSIRMDWRHTGLEVLLEGKSRRLFPNWHMAFFDAVGLSLTSYAQLHKGSLYDSNTVMGYVRYTADRLAKDAVSGPLTSGASAPDQVGVVHRSVSKMSR